MFVALTLVAACGLSVVGGTPDADGEGDASTGAVIVDGSARDSDGSLAPDATADGSDVVVKRDADADAVCKPTASTCKSADECCGQSCQDEDGTLRCQ